MGPNSAPPPQYYQLCLFNRENLPFTFKRIISYIQISGHLFKYFLFLSTQSDDVEASRCRFIRITGDVYMLHTVCFSNLTWSSSLRAMKAKMKASRASRMS